MRAKYLLGTSCVSILAFAVGGAKADPIKIGLMATLSGPASVLGTQVRNGFMLGVKELGGKLGGQPTTITTVDDEFKPDVAVARVKDLLQRDHVDIVTGIVFSNILMAVEKPVLSAGKLLISANAGPSPLAGAACSPLYFSTSFQNDTVHMAMADYANAQGIKNVVLINPNYQAGKDAAAGFKHDFKGKIVDEIYTPIGQMDFSAELAKVASEKPDAIYTFMPGGMGVALVKQYHQSALVGKVKLLSGDTVDETSLPGIQDAALGTISASHWAPNMDNPENKVFVADYEKTYGAPPSFYAAQGYDAAKLIDGALRKTGGKVDTEALRKAMDSVPFKSVRGAFKFNNNGFPIENFYQVSIVKRADGKFVTHAGAKVMSMAKDIYSVACKLPPR